MIVAHDPPPILDIAHPKFDPRKTFERFLSERCANVCLECTEPVDSDLMTWLEVYGVHDLQISKSLEHLWRAQGLIDIDLRLTRLGTEIRSDIRYKQGNQGGNT